MIKQPKLTCTYIAILVLIFCKKYSLLHLLMYSLTTHVGIPYKTLNRNFNTSTVSVIGLKLNELDSSSITCNSHHEVLCHCSFPFYTLYTCITFYVCVLKLNITEILNLKLFSSFISFGFQKYKHRRRRERSWIRMQNALKRHDVSFV